MKKASPYLKINRLEFVITYHCSGSCIHCSLGNRLNQSDSHHHVRIKEATHAMDWLVHNFPVSSVMTFGGEPLLYPDVVCAIHRQAAINGIQSRQLITNGYFSKDNKRIQETAKSLHQSGVNHLLLSIDAFHQETIPIAPVYHFAQAVKQTGISDIKLHPAWVVNEQNENPYNTKTREILSAFRDLEIPVSKGNDIFMAGNAVKYLSDYYHPPELDVSDTCGSMPYTEPLTNITSLSIVPNGNVMVCSFVIGNLYSENIEDIITRYNPYENEYMNAVVTGGVDALMKTAEKKGIPFQRSGCYSICDICRQIVEASLKQ